jgi:pyruvate/2-oxoglutarate/acetoin dehydrogenase E1 component/TPP-dependent pyruvate/acetoin dehydrogenase alpha subunit
MPDTLSLKVALDVPETKTASTQKNNDFRDTVLKDYELCVTSREMSYLGRKEVLTGKAKFGIFGDGLEVPQVALAKFFNKGDWRSGYYRDQTWMLASGVATAEGFFAQLYADSNNDPFSGGRQMNAHFSTPIVNADTGVWNNQLNTYNVASDTSSTAGQMARAIGFALASKKYRELNNPFHAAGFSNLGNEVCFCTIGESSTSEGVFWESVNAAGVMRIPLAIFIWDNGYGISVPSEIQTTKGNISEILKGFGLDEEGKGIELYECKAWDYPSLCTLFEKGIEKIRKTHIPAIFHIQEATQPQGHSTSGSHERYKSKERLQWEREHDCNAVMRRWILESNMATPKDLENIEARSKATASEAKNKAWANYFNRIRLIKPELNRLYQDIADAEPHLAEIVKAHQKELENLREPFASELLKNARQLLLAISDFGFRISDSASGFSEIRNPKLNLRDWIKDFNVQSKKRYSTHLYSETQNSALKVEYVAPTYNDESPLKNGYEIINAFFDKAFENYTHLLAFGEDVGLIGDVNQGLAGLQEKYGVERVFDTGIREWTIMGQAIGLSMRGWRPIAEIQYLDYIYYGLAPLADDLSTLRYRTNGIQCAPAIIRTRGHRLEGIWHSGSPMAMLMNAVRGMYICVPRNFVQAAGMYNTLLQSDDAAIVIESLNSYRLKEKLPSNIGEYTIPLGVPDILQIGTDVTLVTYGSCVKVASEACALLKTLGVSVELIDIQTLLPFDIHHSIVQSLKKTNRIVFLDEDVPGGATAYMLQEVTETQKGFQYLDTPPKTITAAEHRPPYGSDGDYFSKPNIEDVVESILELMRV